MATHYVPSNLFSFILYVDIHVIEFQKQGLPHVDILLTLTSEDKPTYEEDIDCFICAELPDIGSDPLHLKLSQSI